MAEIAETAKVDLLKAMESFTRAARAGSFAAAAAQSDLSRAIIGKHIQDLENYLGVRLFFAPPAG